MIYLFQKMLFPVEWLTSYYASMDNLDLINQPLKNQPQNLLLQPLLSSFRRPFTYICIKYVFAL